MFTDTSGKSYCCKVLNNRRYSKIFHNYRLTIPYAFALLCVIYINQYIPRGPLAFAYKLGSSKICKDNWWKNLLYLTDIYREDQVRFT